jgi:hypothetical protein
MTQTVNQILNSMHDKGDGKTIGKLMDKIYGSSTVAALGSSQATAAFIQAAKTAVTGADGTKAVVLPAGQADDTYKIINTNASNALKIYPPVGGTINSLSVDAAYTLAAAQEGSFIFRTPGQIYTGIVGATSAQIAYLTDAVAGTAAASKCLVLDANKAIGDIAQINVLGAGAVATNQALGATALDANTTGARNTAVGVGALSANTTGVDNTAVGKDALLLAVSTISNTAVGSLSLDACTTGDYNTAVGTSSLSALTVGTGNTAVGSAAADVTTTGTNNTAVGLDSLGANTTGVSNTAIGANAMKAAVSAIDNVIVGKDAMLVATAGDSNVAVGARVMDASTTSTLNVGVGVDALGATTTGSSNVAVGANAMKATVSATASVAVGKDAMLVATAGDNNVAVGAASMDASTTSTNNVAVGFNSLGATTTGSSNVAIGKDAMLVAVSSAQNVAVGATALDAMLGVGMDNTAIGFGSLTAVTTGIKNTAVGSGSGTALTVGTGNVLIGIGAAGSAVGAVDQIVLSAGTGVTGVANAAITLGNNVRAITCNYDTDQTWDAPSDLRMKDVLGASPLGLSFVLRLNPIEYRFKPASEWPKEWGVDPSSTPNTEKSILGLGAQDVKAAMDAEGETVFHGWGVEDNGRQQVGEAAFIYPLINAVKELAAKVAELEGK